MSTSTAFHLQPPVTEMTLHNLKVYPTAACDQQFPKMLGPDDDPIPNSTFPISLGNATRTSKDYVDRIYNAWDKLHAIILGRGETLHKRWMKKKPLQREKILRTAWPEIPESHRPDLQTLLSSPKTGTRLTASSEHAALFKWPYINVEDLSLPRSLLLYLDARGRNLPHVFAHQDYQAVTLGRKSGAFQTADLAAHIILLTGEGTRAMYGKIVHGDRDKQAVFLYKEGIKFDVGTGLLILEIQAHILEFLLECCYTIFPEIPREDVPSNDLPVQRVTELEAVDDHQGLFTVMAESSYKVPAKLDAIRLRQLIQARKAAAEDHIWDLREDPGYFQSMLSVYADHRFEKLKDEAGWLKRISGDKKFWHQIMLKVIDTAYMQFLQWEIICDWAELLCDKFWGSFETLNPLEPLPEGLERIIRHMMTAVECIALCAHLDFGDAAATSAEFKAGFHLGLRSKGGQARRFRKDNKPSKDHLVKLCAVLFDESHVGVRQVGLWGMADEIQRLINKRADMKKRFSAHVYGIFADYTLAAYILRELGDFLPWVNKFRCEGFRTEQNQRRELDSFVQELQFTWLMSSLGVSRDYSMIHNHIHEFGSSIEKSMLSTLEGMRTTAAEAACVPLPIASSLRYPIDKPSTQGNIEAMQKAEDVLDRMWKGVDDAFIKTNGESLHAIFLKHVTKTRKISRTASWVPKTPPVSAGEPAPAVNNNIFVKGDAEEPEVLPRRPFVEEPRVKVKTRGAPSSDASSRSVSDPVADENSAQEQILVKDSNRLAQGAPLTVKLKGRALKVFRTMFHCDHDQQQRSIAFKDFLHAMTRVGFGVEKLYGSVWLFTPGGNVEATPEVNLSIGKRDIQFHEPHPTGEIPYHMARRWGRRLTRTYGWTGSTFGED